MDILKGMALRFKEDYYNEIILAKEMNFDFFQIWFFNGKLSMSTQNISNENAIKYLDFPVILHAVFDIDDFEKYGQELIRLVKLFNHKEVIIHPVCTSKPITNMTVHTLNIKLIEINKKLKEQKVKLYVENNSIIDGFFNSVEDLYFVFKNSPDIGLLLDLAHINNYEHLKEIVSMRFPECIHIADKHFGIPHEHITLGTGDLDFKMIFSEIIRGYKGRVILEAVDTLENIKKSKYMIDGIFTQLPF